MPITTLHFQGHTYEINIRALNWSDANLMARDNGGYLAKITSATENAAIFNLAKAYFNASSTQYIAPDGGGGAYVWIGGTDSVREGTWRWSDGSALSGYANWGAGNGVTEPDNFNGIQDHLGLSLNGWPRPTSSIGSAGEWNDISGTNGLWSIIEWDGLIGTSGADRITGSSLAEDFFGGAGNDTLSGLSGKDSIDAFDGNDFLYGGDGNDQLLGGKGIDQISGGRGVDRMDGGAGADLFLFDDGHSEKGSLRDVILNFQKGSDDLVLRAIDANIRLAGDQNFLFSTSGPRANSVWLSSNGPSTLVRGDINGDTIFDFEIEIRNVLSLTRADFIF